MTSSHPSSIAGKSRPRGGVQKSVRHPAQRSHRRQQCRIVPQVSHSSHGSPSSSTPLYSVPVRVVVDISCTRRPFFTDFVFSTRPRAKFSSSGSSMSSSSASSASLSRSVSSLSSDSSSDSSADSSDMSLLTLPNSVNASSASEPVVTSSSISSSATDDRSCISETQ